MHNYFIYLQNNDFQSEHIKCWPHLPTSYRTNIYQSFVSKIPWMFGYYKLFLLDCFHNWICPKMCTTEAEEVFSFILNLKFRQTSKKKLRSVFSPIQNGISENCFNGFRNCSTILCHLHSAGRRENQFNEKLCFWSAWSCGKPPHSWQRSAAGSLPIKSGNLG